MPGVELRKPRDLCACVSEEHGDNAGACATLLTGTQRRVVSLTEKAGRMPGVELREPRNLCVCVSEERAVSEKCVNTGDARDSALCMCDVVCVTEVARHP